MRRIEDEYRTNAGGQIVQPQVNPLSFEILEEAKDEWSIPTVELMQLVAATENVPWFINGGYVGYQKFFTKFFGNLRIY